MTNDRISMASGGPTDIAILRATAAGDVDEANAAIGAALCTGATPNAFVLLLHDIQDDLLDLASDILANPLAHKLDIDISLVRQVESSTRRHQSEPPPPEFAVLGGSTEAVGLLRLARMVVRRAARSISVLSRPSFSVGEHVDTYLCAVAQLLLVLAFETERREACALPVGGLCGGPPLHSIPNIVRRRPDYAPAGYTQDFPTNTITAPLPTPPEARGRQFR